MPPLQTHMHNRRRKEEVELDHWEKAHVGREERERRDLFCTL